MKIFTLFDSKVSAYTTPFFCRSKGEAVRQLTDAMARQDTMLSLHPEDFTLFELGDFDESNGKIVCHGQLVSIGNALEWKASGSPHMTSDSKQFDLEDAITRTSL